MSPEPQAGSGGGGSGGGHGGPAHLRPRGSSQGGLRQYNERVILQAVRLHGALPAADIARLTGLTAQTVSMISKRLIDEGLLRKHAPVRGKVGQPSVPLALDADGAFSMGVKVGRRSMDVLLLDFTGGVRERWSLAYRVPEPGLVLAEIERRLRDIERLLGPARHDRLMGVGIAAPLSLGGWHGLLGMPADVAQAWQDTDLRAGVARLTAVPVQLLKDTAAACVAELLGGRGRGLRSFLYVFVDTFVGGGLVIDSHLRDGLNGNAGALGSMPLGLCRPAGTAGAGQAPPQLLSVASLVSLERRYTEAGLDPDVAGDSRALLAPWRAATQAWLEESADAIAFSLNAAACLLDLDAVIVDGSFGRALRTALLDALPPALDGYNWEGVTRPPVLAGTIGSDARAIGGAWLPLHAQFSPDRALFLKEPDLRA